VLSHYDAMAGWLSRAAGAGARALDLGCGTGNHALALAAAGMNVVAVDFSPPMLARARGKAAAAGLALELRELDLDRGLPFSDGTFDAVICSYVLQVIADPVGLLGEMRRVMRPDAVALLEVPLRRARGTTPTALGSGDRVLVAVKNLGSHVPGAVRPYDPARLRVELAAAGFTVCEERLFATSCAALAGLSR
jgi:ubiquinone/menaquinone biosynthesis C-methylase UbiE